MLIDSFVAFFSCCDCFVGGLGTPVDKILNGLQAFWTLVDWRDGIVATKKSITVSRSFGSIVRNKNDLKKALANYAARAAEKLRSQDSLCGAISVFMKTNHFSKKDLQ